jgi:hypothetical protein
MYIGEPYEDSFFDWNFSLYMGAGPLHHLCSWQPQKGCEVQLRFVVAFLNYRRQHAGSVKVGVMAVYSLRYIVANRLFKRAP